VVGACLAGQEAMEPPRAVHHSIVAPLRYKAAARLSGLGDSQQRERRRRQVRMAWRFRTKFIGMGTAAGLLRSSTQLDHPLRSLRDHVDPPLQLALQVRDIHLVRDAISVADALHIAVLHHFL
jgi:hypothetical protein